MKNWIKIILFLLVCIIPATLLAIPPGGVPTTVTQGDAEAGTSSTVYSWTPISIFQAIAGWIDTKYWVDITKYGADPTYTSDSTTAIQNAWNALPTYGVLFIPYGQYKITNALVFDGNKHATIIWYGRVRYAGVATNIDVITIGDGSTVQTAIHVYGNIHLSSATTMTSSNALRIRGGSRVTIESVTIGSKDDASTTWWNSIYLDQPDGIWINGGEVRALNDGVRIMGDSLGSADVYFSNFKFSKIGKTDGTSTGAALHIGGGFGGLKFTNTQFMNNSMHVLVDQTLVAITNRELDFSGAQFDTASKTVDNITRDGTAIQLTRTCTARFDNIWLASFGTGINIGSLFAGRVDINGGRIYNGFAEGTASGDGIVTAASAAIINETGVIWRDIAGTMRKCTSGTAASAWSYALAIQEGTIGAENSNLAVSAQTLPVNGNLDVKGNLVVGSTNPATITPDGAGGFSITGQISASAGFNIPKTSGVAGDTGWYEANSTDTLTAGFRGPDDIAASGAYRGKFPNARAAGPDQVMTWTNGSESGTGTASDPYIQSTSFVYRGKAITKSTATDYTVGTTNAAESYGGVVYVTGAATITLPAIADGMNVSIITIGAIAVSVDPNASDKIWLDGTALDDGDKITNKSTAGDIAVCTYYSADGWYCSTNGWTDGGA